MAWCGSNTKTSKIQTEPYSAHDEEECCDCSKMTEDCVRPGEQCGPKLPYIWYPSRDEEKTEEYVRKLECEYACMQRSILTLTTHFARMQFRLRQILQATPQERNKLLRELESLAFKGLSDSDFGDEMPQIKHDLSALGEIKRKQTYVINKLRSQLSELSDASHLSDLDYTYERECKYDKKPASNRNGKNATINEVSIPPVEPEASSSTDAKGGRPVPPVPSRTGSEASRGNRPPAVQASPSRSESVASRPTAPSRSGSISSRSSRPPIPSTPRSAPNSNNASRTSSTINVNKK